MPKHEVYTHKLTTSKNRVIVEIECLNSEDAVKLAQEMIALLHEKLEIQELKAA